MRLTVCLTTICATALVSGCGRSEPVYQGPLFCDLYEERRFSQAEIDWRTANAPWNLRRDVVNNEDYREFCAE